MESAIVRKEAIRFASREAEENLMHQIEIYGNAQSLSMYLIGGADGISEQTETAYPVDVEIGGVIHRFDLYSVVSIIAQRELCIVATSTEGKWLIVGIRFDWDDVNDVDQVKGKIKLRLLQETCTCEDTRDGLANGTIGSAIGYFLNLP